MIEASRIWGWPGSFEYGPLQAATESIVGEVTDAFS